MTQAQLLLKKHLAELGIETVAEWRFHDGRKWRADLACPRLALLFEVDGHYQGKHGAGWGNDNEKSNTAQMLGYRILRFTNREVLKGEAREFVKRWIG